MHDIIKMIILATIAIVPMLILANELSQDEFIKSGAGIGMVAAAAVAIKLLEQCISTNKNNK